LKVTVEPGKPLQTLSLTERTEISSTRLTEFTGYLSRKTNQRMSRKKGKRFFGLAMVAIILGLAAYGFLLEPNWIEVNHVWIRNPELSRALHGKVAVHLSDLHIGKKGKTEEEILRLLEELKPDLVFLTGDYVKWKGGYEAALTFLSKLEAKIGVWAVMGDYDYSNSRKSCLFCHEPGTGNPTKRHQVKFLRNGIEKGELDGEAFWIGGIDGEGDRDPAIRETVTGWKEKKPTLILSHDPLNFDLLDKDQGVLVLSGDTHGGQIPMPSWIWRLLGYDKNAKYPQGLYEDGRKKMVVSRGVGSSHVPFRFLRRPEVVVIHFE